MACLFLIIQIRVQRVTERLAQVIKEGQNKESESWTAHINHDSSRYDWG